MMKNDDLTIKEVAEKLNVTKQCIYYKLNNEKELKNYVYKRDGIKFIKKEGINLIHNSLNEEIKEEVKYNKSNSSEANKIYEIYEKHIDNLNKEIEHLKKESEEKNNMINSILNESKEKNKLLENMQVLLKEQKLTIESFETKKMKNNSWWKIWEKNEKNI
jgi:hypothetical protein